MDYLKFSSLFETLLEFDVHIDVVYTKEYYIFAVSLVNVILPKC